MPTGGRFPGSVGGGQGRPRRCYHPGLTGYHGHQPSPGPPSSAGPRGGRVGRGPWGLGTRGSGSVGRHRWERCVEGPLSTRHPKQWELRGDGPGGLGAQWRCWRSRVPGVGSAGSKEAVRGQLTGASSEQGPPPCLSPPPPQEAAPPGRPGPASCQALSGHSKERPPCASGMRSAPSPHYGEYYGFSPRFQPGTRGSKGPDDPGARLETRRRYGAPLCLRQDPVLGLWVAVRGAKAVGSQRGMWLCREPGSSCVSPGWEGLVQHDGSGARDATTQRGFPSAGICPYVGHRRQQVRCLGGFILGPDSCCRGGTSAGCHGLSLPLCG